MPETKKSAESTEPKVEAKAATKTTTSEKSASAKKHVVTPGISAALYGPSSDDLNPAYAALKADEE